MDTGAAGLTSCGLAPYLGHFLCAIPVCGHRAVSGTLPMRLLFEPFVKYFQKQCSLVEKPVLPPSISCVKPGFSMAFNLFLIFSFLVCMIIPIYRVHRFRR